MDLQVLLFVLTLLVYTPLTGILLYVWHKHGADEKKVILARIIFLAGSLALFGCMLSL